MTKLGYNGQCLPTGEGIGGGGGGRESSGGGNWVSDSPAENGRKGTVSGCSDIWTQPKFLRLRRCDSPPATYVDWAYVYRAMALKFFW